LNSTAQIKFRNFTNVLINSRPFNHLALWYDVSMNFFDAIRPELPGHPPTDPDTSGPWLSVPEAVVYCAENGLARNIKTVRRWAQRSLAHPENAEMIVREQDTENGFRYVIEQSSLDRKIAQELEFEAKRSGADTSPPDPTGTDMSSNESAEKMAELRHHAGEDRSEPVRTEPDTPVRRLEVASIGNDFLKDQIGQKDLQISELNRQLERRDEQIMTMLERDRETNHLINGLQEALSQSLGIESPTRMQLKARREGDSATRADRDDAV
jgi:hypothetical protein